MRENSGLKQKLDELIELGEQAAVQLDGETIQKVTEDLCRWEEELLNADADEAFLQYARNKLKGYTDCCGFVAETMHDALVYAGCQASNGGGVRGGYGKQGGEQVSIVQPVFMKTYG